MWKDFFYFSKTERAGFYLLVALILVALTVYWLLPDNPSPRTTKHPDESVYEQFISSVHKREKERNQNYYFPDKEEKIELKAFDPNTADSLTFVRLGLPSFIARNILRYRSKGGKFQTRESFARIYGLSTEQYKKLLPYITIGDEFLKKNDSIRAISPLTVRDSLKYFKYPEGTVICLNEADTTELKKIPGIGIGTAKQIIAYRQKLGGFYKVGQLQDNARLPTELNKWFIIKNGPFHRININRLNIDRLINHPYINFYQAKVIIEHRKKKGAIKNLKELSLYEEFTSKDLERLTPYICF
ncbi:ComEA family DNA-binding protein [Bacteroides sedimenti]|uniref:Competence protein ComEA n=1 Tax=Bacteroides sedimenti TaxID=2136147 RepID=A0ABM8IE33_9BACE